MSKTFKTQPWKVKAAKWHAGNAQAHHSHHHYHVQYEDAVDKFGNVIYETGEELVRYPNYLAYAKQKERAGLPYVDQSYLPVKELDVSEYSHEEKIWLQRVRVNSFYGTKPYGQPYKKVVFSTTSYEVVERVPYHRAVQRVVQHPEIVCTINEVPDASNDWGQSFPCHYYNLEPLKMMYRTDRIIRKNRSKKFNRALSRKELREAEKHSYAGDMLEDDAFTAHLVLKRNDYLG